MPWYKKGCGGWIAGAEAVLPFPGKAPIYRKTGRKAIRLSYPFLFLCNVRNHGGFACPYPGPAICR